MSDGAKKAKTEGRTVRDCQTLTVTLPTGGVVEITQHGGRTRWQMKVPGDAVVGTPEFRDVRNQDDGEG